ncbi:Uncharacterised protein [[Clostridium] symbiosum]|nr:Uncharacterised protein [[Clostridium] symbiosum]
MRRGHGSPPVLSEVPHELSIPMRTPKSANVPRSNSFRPDSPSTTNFPRGRKTQPSPHHTGHGPFRTRPPTSVKSPFRARNNRTAQTIIYRKYVVAATRFPSPLRLETISGRNGLCPVPRKSPPESSVPGDNLTRGSRRNQLRRGDGCPPALSEVPHELSIPMRTPKSANVPRSNSFRPDSPSTTNFPRGRKTQPSPHHTGHGPFRTRPPTSVKSPFRARNNRTAQTIIYRKYVVAATRFPSPLRLETISGRNGLCPVPRKPPPESFVPGDNLPRGSRRNQLRRGHGSPPVLSEVPHELSTAAHSKECKRSPQQFIPAGFPPSRHPPTGAGRLRQTPSPHRT